MVSKKCWEKFRRDVEDLTKTGVEKQCWGKSLTSKDVNKNLFRKHQKSNSLGLSFEATEKVDDDIERFSSSGEEDASRALRQPPRNHSYNANRNVGLSVPTEQRKRHKKRERSDIKDGFSFANFPFQTTESERPKQVESGFKRRRTSSFEFENSFASCSPYLASLSTSNQHGFSPMLDTSKSFERQQDTGKVEIEDIAWSDSESSNYGQLPQEQTGNSEMHISFRDKTLLSCVLMCAPKSSQPDDEKQVAHIEEFNSDTDEYESTLFKVFSPSISPIATPTPTSPKPEENEARPPIDSSKKKKHKYLRSGLAERLQKLLARERSEKAFWFHKLQQLKDDQAEDCSSSQTAGTLTLCVVSEALDHGVYVIHCDVISQDVISDRELPGKVAILLDTVTRKRLQIQSTPYYLRIYSPWKIFDLADSPLPVLLCITHCEVIEELPSHLQVVCTKPVALPAAKQVHGPRTKLQLSSKVIRTRLFSSSACDTDNNKIRPSTDANKAEELGELREKSAAEISTRNPCVSRSLCDVTGIQGQCLNSRIDFPARIQRIYWRNERKRSWNLTSTRVSSLVQSIVDRSRVFKEESNMSLCLLVQDAGGVCCEVRISSETLLRRTDWQELLCQAEASALAFQGLRLVEHRKRKRRLGLFGLIDSLRDTTSFKNNITKQEMSKCPVRQSICFIFSTDEQTVLRLLSQDEAKGCSPYYPPDSLSHDDLQPDLTGDSKRVKAYGKLLYAVFEPGQRYSIKHVRLFVSGIFIAEESTQSSISDTPRETLMEVWYSHARDVEWNESTLLAGQLLFMQDFIIKNVEGSRILLTGDMFSKIQLLVSQSAFRNSFASPATDIGHLWRKTITLPMDDMKYRCLKSLPHDVVAKLSADTVSDTLVMFEGIIVDVDEENAFRWMACNLCGSEDISELQEDSLYICKSCGLDVDSPITNTHLEVYLKSVASPELRVKAKLLQSTISSLLAASDVRSDEGYDVQCVLNKRLGPMTCYVVQSCSDGNNHEGQQISFKLEEIESSRWAQ